MPTNELPKIKNLLNFSDERGSMKILLENTNFSPKIVKTTQSQFGVLRGFHVQLSPLLQEKIIYVLNGEIQDILIEVDTYGKPTGQIVENILNAENSCCELYIPPNWAHAYLTLSKQSTVLYLCNQTYGNEISLNPLVNYKNWNIPIDKMIISKKDMKWPLNIN